MKDKQKATSPDTPLDIQQCNDIEKGSEHLRNNFIISIGTGLIIGFILDKYFNLDFFATNQLIATFFIPVYCILFIISIIISLRSSKTTRENVKFFYFGISIFLTFSALYKSYLIITYYTRDPIALIIRRHIGESPITIDSYFSIIRSLLFIGAFGLLERIMSMSKLLRAIFTIFNKYNRENTIKKDTQPEERERMFVLDEEVYNFDDLIVYEFPPIPPKPIKGMRDWHISSRRSQCHFKPMAHIILGHDVGRDKYGIPVISDIVEIVNHEYLHALLYLLSEHRLGTSLDFYWYKYYKVVKPPSEMVSLLEELSYSGIGFPCARPTIPSDIFRKKN